MTGAGITGADLRALRKAARLTQARLTDLAGVSRDCVQYWERKPRVDLSSWGPRHMMQAIGRTGTVAACEALAILWQVGQYARARIHAALTDTSPALKARLAAAAQREAERAAKRRVPCKAKTRKGTPCRMKSEPGRARCKFHGGMSTGAKTPEGRDRIRQAQLRRWARWRAEHGRETAK